MTKEMIFDLQLFADTIVSGGTTSDTISISQISSGTSSDESIQVTYQTDVIDDPGSPVKTSTLKGGSSSILASGGDDSITVGTAVAGLTIDGGAGNDYITIASGAGANVFVVGEGNDTIEGYNDTDTILIDNPVWDGTAATLETLMSADGNSLIIKNGTKGKIYLKGVNADPSTPTSIKVQKANGSSAAFTLTPIKMMQGDNNDNNKADKIDNTGSTAHSGGTSSSAWTIDGGSSKDTIENSGEYVSINGGAGADLIEIKAQNDGTKDTEVTKGVTIRGGLNADTIDVTADIIDSSGATLHGGHVYEFGNTNGKDWIFGYNEDDSIVFDSDVTLSNVSLRTDADGTFYIYPDKNSVSNNYIAIKQMDKPLGGTKLKLYQRKNNGTLETLDNNNSGTFSDCWVADTNPHFEIPKVILLTTAGTKTFDSNYDGYTIKSEALNYQDELIVSAKGVLVDAGYSNDTITLKDGTNVTQNATNNTYDVAKADAVTIIGGEGNDLIDATADIKVNTTDGETIRASHVYEVSTTSGKDTILGFNSNDTIKINDYVAANPEITASYNTDGTDDYFILKIGVNSKIAIKLDDEYFNGGQNLHIVDGDNNTINAVIDIDNFEGVTLEQNATSGVYILPKIKKGTDSTDNLSVTVDGFKVYGLDNNDTITGKGASNVLLDGGGGDDVIQMESLAVTPDGATVADTIFGQNVTIHGGEGDDTIYNEYVTVASNASNIGYATDIGNGNYARINRKRIYGHVYTFGYQDGDDTIYFFNDKDTIKLADDSFYTTSYVDGEDFVIEIVGPNKNNPAGKGTIRLKDYIKVNTSDPSYDPYNQPVTIIDKSGEADNSGKPTTKVHTVLPQKEWRGTTGNDNLEKYDNGYLIQAISGDDEIQNGGDSSTIDTGYGNDTIHNSGNEVSINAGADDDVIFLDEHTPGGNTIVADTGNDTIYSNGFENVFIFKPDQGKNYIANFQPDDTIQIEGVNNNLASVTTAVTNEGFVIYVNNEFNNSESTQIILKGEFAPPDDYTYADQDALDVALSDMNNAKAEYDAASTTDPNYNTKKYAYENARQIYYDKKAVYDKTYLNKLEYYKNLEGDTTVFIKVGANSTESVVVPRLLVGTSDTKTPDTLNVSDEMENYTVEAYAGNDTITSDAIGASINAGIGKDVIELKSGAASNTIYGGKNNDYIINTISGGGHLFEFNSATDGWDTIVGFNANDTLAITGGDSVTATMGNAGLEIVVLDTNKNTKLGSVIIKDFDFDNKINIGYRANDSVSYDYKSDKVNGGTEVKFDPAVYGTESNDQITVTSANNGYTYYALGGKDTIKVDNGVRNVSINAGIGQDIINVVSAESSGITIAPGADNDTINLPKEISSLARVFVVKKGQGVNTINGICKNDTLVIESSDPVDSETSIVSAKFDSEDYFVITLNDYVTKIKLKGIEEVSDPPNTYNYGKLGGLDEDGNVTTTTSSFKIKINGKAVETYKVPRIMNITDTDTTVAKTITLSDVVVAGNDNPNNINIQNTSQNNYISVNGGAGSDTITVTQGKGVSITGGKGADFIELKTDEKHVITYTKGDGDDTIKGWQNDNILKIDGFANKAVQSYGFDMAGTNGDTFVITLYGGARIVFEDVKAGEDYKSIWLAGDILNYLPADDQNIKTRPLSNGSIKAVELKVPHLIKGSTTAPSELNAEGNKYTIVAGDYNDTITSKGLYSSIKSGSGADLIYAEGNNLTISGENHNDTINIDNSKNSSVYGGNGDDVISLGSEVSNSTITGAGSNDVIFGNGKGNVFYYETWHGSDTIYGFSSKDSLMIIGNDLIPTTTTTEGGQNITVIDPTAVNVTAEGLVIRLKDKDKSTLTLKGQKKDTADTNNPDDFEFLTSNDNFKIYIGSNSSDTVKVNITDKQVARVGEIFENDTTHITVAGATNASDTIYNRAGADNVTIDTGTYADYIYNEANNVYINSGALNDVIYLSKPYSFDATGNQIPDNLDTALASFDSLAKNNTIEAGKGDDTIWGNRRGDYDSSDAHVYKYNKGEGKDVIYDFGKNDTIVFGADITKVSFEYLDTTKKERTYVDDDETDNVAGEWVYVDVDDPDHKDVKITTNDGSIILKGLDIGQTINYELKGNPYNVAVEKIHTIAKGVTTALNPFVNETDEYTIKTAGGNTYVENKADGSVISLSSGLENIITNSGNESTLIGSKKADTVTNTGDEVFINVAAGDNTVKNEGMGVTIKAGANADTITNSGSDVSIDAGAGMNIITNSGSNVTISTDKGNDKVTNTGDNVTINTAAGDDTIYVNSSATDVVVKAGKGDNVIFGSNTEGSRTYIYDSSNYVNDTIVGWNDSDILQLNLANGEEYGSTLTAQGLIIKIYSDNTSTTTLGTITIANATKDGDGNIIATTPLSGDTEVVISKTQDSATTTDVIKIPFQKFNQPVSANENGYTILGTENKDTLSNEGKNTTIEAGIGDDTIYTSGDGAVVNAEEGNDLIVLATEANYNATDKIIKPDAATALGKITEVNINGGKGNDTIIADNAAKDRAGKIIYNYNLGDGNDIIRGFKDQDLIQITGGTYSTSVDSLNNFIISVSSGNTVGSIKLEGNGGVAGTRVNIATRSTDTDDFVADDVIVVPTLVTIGSSRAVTNTADVALIQGTSNNDTITSRGDNVSIYAGNGNDKIILDEDKSGVTVFAGGDSDTIEALEEHNSGILYVFKNTDGGNRINNYSSNDSIKFEGVAWDPSAEGAISLLAAPTEENEENKNIILAFGGTQVSLMSYDDNVNIIYTGANDQEQNFVFSTSNIMPGSSESDTLNNSDDEYIVYGYGGNDTIDNEGAKVKIYGGTGTDSITSKNGANVSIFGGADADRIIHNGEKGYIVGGAGNDSITVQTGSGQSTIVIEGNDSITIEDNNISENGKGFLYEISGKETSYVSIKGFTAYDTIKVTGTDISINQFAPNQSFSTDSSGNNYYMFMIGNTTLFVNGAGAEQGSTIGVSQGSNMEFINVPKLTSGTTTGDDVILSFNGSDANYKGKLPEGADYDEVTAAYKSSKYFVDALSGHDYIDNIYDEVTINAGTGNDTIYNREGTGNEKTGTKVSINGDTGDDSIKNEATSVTITAGSGKDTITNTGTQVTISGDAGNDFISNAAANVMINAGSDNDTITNESIGTQVTINGDAGDDFISNDAANVMINAGYNNDTIKNTANNVTINAGFGNDSIENTAANAHIKYIFNSNSNVTTIKGWTDNSTLYFPNLAAYNVPTQDRLLINSDGTQMSLTADGNTIIFISDTTNTFGKGTALNIVYGANETPLIEEGLTPGARQLESGTISAPAKSTLDSNSSGMTVNSGSVAGEITIAADAKQLKLNAEGYSNSSKINILKNAEINGWEDGITVQTGNGKDTIDNADNYVIIGGGSGDDSISNSGANVSINGGSNNDIINNTGENATNVTINGGDGNDNIQNSAANVSIFGGGNADFIQNSADTATNVTINGGSGDDTIENAANNVLIDGGADNDIIINRGTEGVTIKPGTGSDSIDNTNGAKTTYYFESRSDVTTIKGYNDTDTLYFAGATNVGTASINSTYTQVSLTGSDGTTVILEGDFSKTESNQTVIDTDKTKFKVKCGNETAEVNPDIKVIFLSDQKNGDSANRWINNNNNVTVNSGRGDNFVGNTGTGVLITGNINDSKNIVNSAIGDNVNEAVTINTGYGNDTVSITDKAAYALVSVGSANTSNSNYVSSAGSYITVHGGNDIYSFDQFDIQATAKKSIFNGYAGNDKFTVAAATNADNINTISGGAGNDEFIIQGTLNSINGGSDNDQFTIATTANANTIFGDTGIDEFIVQGTSNIIDGGGDNDKFTVDAEATAANANTIFGGEGNDVFTINDGKHGNIFRYNGNSAEGTDTIIGYAEGDTIQIDSNVAVTETGGKFTFGNTSIVIQDAKKDDLVTFKVKDADGNLQDKTWIVGGTWKTATTQTTEPEENTTPGTNGRVADYNYFMEEIFEDSNDTFTTDIGNDLSDIDYLNKDTYSTGNIEDANAENLVQNSDIITASYGKNENQQ